MDQAVETLINELLAKKLSGRLERSEIKEHLKQETNYSTDEIKFILTEISNRELSAVQEKKSALNLFLESHYFSYFFLFFGLAVIITSIFIVNLKVDTVFGKTLPWVTIFGGIFIVFKHGIRIAQFRKQKED